MEKKELRKREWNDSYMGGVIYCSTHMKKLYDLLISMSVSGRDMILSGT